MIVDRFKLTSDTLGDILDLRLYVTSTPQSYILKGAQGFDIDSVLPVNYGMGFNNVKFYSMNLEPRVIVLKLSLNPNRVTSETFQSLRDKVYRAISSGRDPSLTLTLMHGTVIGATIRGYISKVDATYFESEPELQITITCPDPFFYGPIYSEPSMTAFNSGAVDINEASGNAPTGFTLVVNVTTPIASWGLSDISAEWFFNVTYDFQPSDELTIITEPGKLDVYIMRYNSTTSSFEKILLGDRIDADSMWPILFPGLNQFTVLATTGLYEITEVTYYPKYWGI